MLVENQTTEFKREYTENIKKTVIAFANTDGGKLLIGIDDDGTPCGVDDPDGTMLKVTNVIRDAIKPDVTLFAVCSRETVDGKKLVIVDVQRGTSRPYYLAGKGIRPEGVYVRQGASTVPASEAAIFRMIRETSGDCYENARSLNQQLTFEKAGAFFQKRGLEFGEAQKRTLGIIGEDGTYTNLGLLLSEQCMHTTKIAVFEGGTRNVFRDRIELAGSILGQLEEAYSFIERYNRTRAEFQGLERIDIRDYPPEAIREALLNAIVHREYAFRDSTLISVFDDRIEFVTIGGLVKGITFDDIILGVSVLRNMRLADVFYRLKLIEAYGTGIMKINDCYAKSTVKPRISVTDNAFKIMLPNTNSDESDEPLHRQSEKLKKTPSVLEKRESEVINMLDVANYIVRKDVQDMLKVSQATAILLLREMTEKGMIVKEGSGKYLCYKLKNDSE